MNLMEVERALRQLRLGGMANVVEARVREAQTESSHTWIWWGASSPTN